jgi:hypothetical protein
LRLIVPSIVLCTILLATISQAAAGRVPVQPGPQVAAAALEERLAARVVQPMAETPAAVARIPDTSHF